MRLVAERVLASAERSGIDMAKTTQRKLFAVDHRNEKGAWELTRFGEMHREHRAQMLDELARARQQYPDEKYKLTTYVPKEPITVGVPWPKSTKKKKAEHRRKSINTRPGT